MLPDTCVHRTGSLPWTLALTLGVLAFPLTGRAQQTEPTGSAAAPAPDCRPAPQAWKSEAPPDGVREIHYESPAGRLLAWFATPQGNGGDRYPVLIYLHGGYSFSRGDFEQARPLLASGFAVLTPTVRGENGNPGCFEMFSGEVDDVLAAVRWAVDQPSVDRERVYVFGHSIGGALASLACLRPKAGIRSGGAISGLYDDAFFSSAKAIAPFDVASAEEKHRRLFLPQVESLHVPFVFYLESSRFTPKTVEAVDSMAKHAGAPASAVLLTGNHMSIVPTAIDAFIARLRSQESLAGARSNAVPRAAVHAQAVSTENSLTRPIEDP